MNHILYLQQNNIVAILNGSGGTLLADLEKQVPVGLPWIIIKSEQLPDPLHLNVFRNFLTADFDSPGQPNVRLDLEKCKNYGKDLIREYRKPKFAANDIVLRDAMLSNDTLTIKTATLERNRLKDLTKVLNYVSSVEQILQQLEVLDIKV